MHPFPSISPPLDSLLYSCADLDQGTSWDQTHHYNVRPDPSIAKPPHPLGSAIQKMAGHQSEARSMQPGQTQGPLGAADTAHLRPLSPHMQQY